MKIYIAGVISKGGTLSGDVITENIQRFTDAEKLLCEQGHDPVNPTTLHAIRSHDTLSHTEWASFMRQDICKLVTCDAIYLLPGWQESRGALLEAHIADELGLVTLYPPANV